jgi:hypothetical protein
MDAKIKSFSSIKLLSSSEAMAAFLRSIESEEVKHELLRWLYFGANDERNLLTSLDWEQLALFMDKLPDLVLILYARQMEIQKGADK